VKGRLTLTGMSIRSTFWSLNSCITVCTSQPGRGLPAG
jgi:hypothetical protein